MYGSRNNRPASCTERGYLFWLRCLACAAFLLGFTANHTALAQGFTSAAYGESGAYYTGSIGSATQNTLLGSFRDITFTSTEPLPVGHSAQLLIGTGNTVTLSAGETSEFKSLGNSRPYFYGDIDEPPVGESEESSHSFSDTVCTFKYFIDGVLSHETSGNLIVNCTHTAAYYWNPNTVPNVSTVYARFAAEFQFNPLDLGDWEDITAPPEPEILNVSYDALVYLNPNRIYNFGGVELQGSGWTHIPFDAPPTDGNDVPSWFVDQFPASQKIVDPVSGKIALLGGHDYDGADFEADLVFSNPSVDWTNSGSITLDFYDANGGYTQTSFQPHLEGAPIVINPSAPAVLVPLPPDSPDEIIVAESGQTASGSSSSGGISGSGDSVISGTEEFFPPIHGGTAGTSATESSDTDSEGTTTYNFENAEDNSSAFANSMAQGLMDNTNSIQSKAAGLLSWVNVAPMAIGQATLEVDLVINDEVFHVQPPPEMASICRTLLLVLFTGLFVFGCIRQLMV